MPEESDYSLTSKSQNNEIDAPNLPYRARHPENYQPKIGLIACGGITEHHLKAYKKAGFNVVALCDLIEERAIKRRAQFFPDAIVTTNYREILERDDIEVVDIATHPRERLPLLEETLNAGKHVLSQKPFVLNLDEGERLVKLANHKGLKLAVNQNGRWAPHFSYLREAVKAGLLGDLMSLHFGVHWDHSWTLGTPFDEIYDLVFYDFAIHWFDLFSHLLGDRKITSVQAMRNYAVGQKSKPPMLAQAIISFEGGQGSLVFDANTPFGSWDHTYVSGSKGSFKSEGSDLGHQQVTLTTGEGVSRTTLRGDWFPDGFHGTMGELLCAIDENREPLNSARENLKSLALCFAAIASASEGVAKTPGQVRKLPSGSAPGAD